MWRYDSKYKIKIVDAQISVINNIDILNTNILAKEVIRGVSTFINAWHMILNGNSIILNVKYAPRTPWLVKFDKINNSMLFDTVSNKTTGINFNLEIKSLIFS